MKIIEDTSNGKVVEGFSWKTMGRRKVVTDCWMWNGKYSEYTDGTKSLDTAKFTKLFDVAKAYWLDGFIPIKGLTEDILRAMETELRSYYKNDNLRVPDVEFLFMKEIPDFELTGKATVGKTKVSKIETLVTDDTGQTVGTKIEAVEIPDFETLKAQYRGRSV